MTSSDALAERIAADGGARPRADARRNVERLVAAAREAVAEVGLEVSTHEIARRAGVGVGTFYRRIPSREALLEAILVEVLTEARARADEALADPDAGAAFERFAAAYVELRAASRGVCEALDGLGGPALEEARSRMREGFRLIVERTQRAGALRRDVEWHDVPFLLAALIPPTRKVGLDASDAQWRRSLRVLLDGLRTSAGGDRPGGSAGEAPAPSS